MTEIKIRKAYTLVELDPHHVSKLIINTPDNITFEATPHTTSMFMYLGRFALYNHAELNYTKDRKLHQQRVFSDLSEPAYSHIRDFMYIFRYPNIHTNLMMTPSDVVRDYDEQFLSIEHPIPEWLSRI